MGGCRVGVIHGDPQGLAGWGFGVEMMRPLDAKLREALGVSTGLYTRTEDVMGWFEKGAVSVYACTHTCLPYGQVRDDNGSNGMIWQ